MRTPEQTRDLITRKALSLFNTKGYKATSLSDITKEVGLTKGAIYGHFGSKDGVAEAGFEYALKFVKNDLNKRISAAVTAPEKLKAIVNYYSDYILNPPIKGGCPIINTAIEADDSLPLLRTKLVHFISMMKQSLIKIIYRGVTEGQIRKDVNVEETAVLLYTAVEGGIMLSRVEGDPQTYETLRRRLIKEIDQITT